MDVILIDKTTLRIKGKNSSLVINPTASIGKTEADAILFSEANPDFSDKKIEGFRITITGPGEYETSGTKISAIKVEEKLVVKLDVDGVKVLVGSGSSIEKISDKVEECDILAINSDSEFNNSFIASIEPKIVLLYGANKEEVVKSLGKESSEKTTKFSTTLEKLPQELQFVLLG